MSAPLSLLSVDELQARIFDRPECKSIKVTGHVQEVHAGHWLAVYMYGPESLNLRKFEEITGATNLLVLSLWPEPPCHYPADMGRTPNKEHFYCFWLAVPPQRRFPDFAKFFPLTGLR